MKARRLYVENVTVIDYCRLDWNNKVIGDSVRLGCMVSGILNGKEQVIVDFGTLKKDIKAIIDDLDTGIDHKLVLFKSTDTDHSYLRETETGFMFREEGIRLELPFNAVHLVPNYEYAKLNLYLDEWLLEELQKKYPLITEVKCSLDHEFSVPTLPGLNKLSYIFHYQHGLKNSTSEGCQNITHGHRSVITLYTNILSKEELADNLAVAQSMITNAVFVYSDNVTPSIEGVTNVAYATPRGVFKASYSNTEYNVIILSTETTIENLAVEILNIIIPQLQPDTIAAISVSEGLCKGSIVFLDDLLESKPRINVIGTTTGRSSSSHDNECNMEQVRTKEGIRVWGR
jgi:hypothetical protein